MIKKNLMKKNFGQVFWLKITRLLKNNLKKYLSRTFKTFYINNNTKGKSLFTFNTKVYKQSTGNNI